MNFFPRLEPSHRCSWELLFFLVYDYANCDYEYLARKFIIELKRNEPVLTAYQDYSSQGFTA